LVYAQASRNIVSSVQSNVLAARTERETKRERERWNREAEELEKLPMSELVLPLRYTAEEGRIVITEIQWTLRNRRPFFFFAAS